MTGDLHDWAAAQRLAFDVTDVDEGQRWGARLEDYLKDPTDRVPLGGWTTDLQFLLQ